MIRTLPRKISSKWTTISKPIKSLFFVLNAQETNEITDGIVKQCQRFGIPVLKVTESKPVGKTYQQWMMSQYQELAKIQQKANTN